MLEPIFWEKLKKIFQNVAAFYLVCKVLSKNKISGMVERGKGVVYLKLPGRPTDTGLQLGKACYPCSR